MHTLLVIPQIDSTRKALVIEVLATCTQDEDVVAKTITMFG